MREVLNAIFYLDRSGCQWDMPPHDLPAKSTVYDHFAQFKADGTWDRIKEALARQVRLAADRDPSPRTASIDGQTVGGERGDDGGKKITGRKRQIVADSLGLPPRVPVTVASADEGTTAPRVLGRLGPEPTKRLELVRGDKKYRDEAPDRWMKAEGVRYEIEVIKRPVDAEGFVLLPKRWVVGRPIAWMGRSRRRSQDYEWGVGSSEAMIKRGEIQGMLRRLDPNRGMANPFKYPKKPEAVAG